jgi:ABC-type multidrug transport system ATPase subunit
VCPQYDILWDELTVKEHLLFYARLKGIKDNQEESEVKSAMESVYLDGMANRLSRGLSGGEKRRLSIAISLIGNPRVVFLDEPTTG